MRPRRQRQSRLQLAHEAAPPAAPANRCRRPQTAVPQTAASERKGPRLLPLAAPAEAEKAPAGPTLKREAIVTGDIVRIGDLIENAGVVAEVAIFRAPDLGQTGSVPARRVAEVVRPHQIVGLDTRGIDDVLVTRASRAISVKEIEARLIRALAAQYGLADTTDLAIAFDHEVRTLYVEPSAHAELAPTRLSYDPRSRRFDAVLELTGGTRRAPIRLMGVLTETFETAVPLRTARAGRSRQGIRPHAGTPAEERIRGGGRDHGGAGRRPHRQARAARPASPSARPI